MAIIIFDRDCEACQRSERDISIEVHEWIHAVLEDKRAEARAAEQAAKARPAPPVRPEVMFKIWSAISDGLGALYNLRDYVETLEGEEPEGDSGDQDAARVDRDA
jgi:hypothetical protein